MSAPLNILHLEDNELDAELVQCALDASGVNCRIRRVITKEDFVKALGEGTFDIILSDFSLPTFDGMSALEIAQKTAGGTPFIFVSGTIGEERAVESLRKGAVDYVLKDRTSRLVSAIERAHREAQDREQRGRDEALIRKQAELLNQARDAIFVRDLNQHITYWNHGAERLYGWKAEEVMGRRASEFLYPPGAPSRDDIWRKVLEAGEWQGDLTQVTKAGREVHVSSRRTLLKGSQGNPVAVLNINTDITEKRNLETQVLRSQRLDSIGSLASGIAHDLNNVLAPIMMATELVQDRIEDEESRRMLEVAKASARRGADLVKQILQFARGSKGESAIVNLGTLVKELGRFAKNTFPPSIKVETDVEDRLEVLGDATQVHQVILNLCVNGRDAMPNGGKLTIHGRRVSLRERVVEGRPTPISGNFVEISVQDSGAGIPPDVLPRIFEPFFSTKAPDKGTGLGLSTVATIVRNHNGVMEVTSVLGQGTIFRIYLPEGRPAGPSQNQVEQGAIPTGKGEWLLLVDDERGLLEMTKELLEAYGYNVLTATDGTEALIQFTAHLSKIRVVITDLLMPGLGGRQLLSAIRDIAPNVIAICLSGSADEDMIRSDQVGANAFLRKPCPIAELLATLARVLGR